MRNDRDLNRDIHAVSLAVSNLFRNLHNSGSRCRTEAYTNVQDAMISMRRALPRVKGFSGNAGKHIGFLDHVKATEA